MITPQAVPQETAAPVPPPQETAPAENRFVMASLEGLPETVQVALPKMRRQEQFSSRGSSKMSHTVSTNSGSVQSGDSSIESSIETEEVYCPEVERAVERVMNKLPEDTETVNEHALRAIVYSVMRSKVDNEELVRQSGKEIFAMYGAEGERVFNSNVTMLTSETDYELDTLVDTLVETLAELNTLRANASSVPSLAYRVTRDTMDANNKGYSVMGGICRVLSAAVIAGGFFGLGLMVQVQNVMIEHEDL